MSDVLIRNAAAILTGARGVGARAKGPDIRIRDGRITSIGMLGPEPGEATIDATDCVVYPAWVNTHHHLFQSLLKGEPQGLNATLTPWLAATPYRFRAGFDAQRFRLAARVGLVELALSARQGLFDSGPASVALTAVSLTHSHRELEALEAIQHARYVDGSDVTSLTSLVGLLEALDLEEAAAKLAHPNADLLDAHHARVGRAQALMREFGARGVPTLIVESGGKRWVLDHAAGYSNQHSLLSQLEAA